MNHTDNYEIHFSRQKGRWNLAEVMYDANAAMAHATEIAAEPGTLGVRVVSSRFDPVLDGYSERTIFSRSNDGDAKAAAEDGDAGLGCRAGADLYGHAGRRAIQRVLATELERRRITVLELLHDYAHARSVADTGTILQAAVQRHAIDTAQSGSSSVAGRVKRLYGIVEEAMVGLRHIAGRPDRPMLADGGLGQVARDWADRPDGDAMVFSALAWYLRPATDWSEKLSLLVRALPPRSTAAELRFVDAIAEEILEARGGFAAFFDANPRGGDAVLAMLSTAEQKGAKHLTAATAAFLDAAGGIVALPILRAALATRARRIVDMAPSLGDGTVADEHSRLHAAWRIVSKASPASPVSQLAPILERRSERYAGTERLGVLLGEIREPVAQLEQLIALEPLVLGDVARRMVGQYIRTILVDRSTPVGLEDQGDANPSEQLRRFVQWQRKLLTSGLPPPVRKELAALVDQQAVRVLRERKVFGAMARRFNEPWRQVLGLMDLVTTDHFTQGQAKQLATEFISQRLKSDGVLSALQKAMEADPQIAARGRAMHDFLAN